MSDCVTVEDVAGAVRNSEIVMVDDKVGEPAGNDAI